MLIKANFNHNFSFMDVLELKKSIPFLEPQLIDEILEVGVVQEVKKTR